MVAKGACCLPDVRLARVMASKEAPSRCRNCDQELVGVQYCPKCGQRDIDFKRDWKGLVAEYASSMFNFEGKVPQGIIDLLFRPGKMTVEFLQGKRASQIPPVRLYLFASLVFFIWASYNGEFELEDLEKEQLEQIEFDDDIPVSPDFARKIAEKFQDSESIKNEFYSWLPRVFLLGVPVLALATRLVFRKRDLVYLEHMIISMHLQTFLLLWILLLSLLEFIVGKIWPWGSQNLVERIDLWILIYPVFASRRIFNLSWLKAIVATLVLELVFIVMVIVGVIAVMALAIWFA